MLLQNYYDKILKIDFLWCYIDIKIIDMLSYSCDHIRDRKSYNICTFSILHVISTYFVLKTTIKWKPQQHKAQ